MISMEEMIRKRLKNEADKWMVDELVVRMKYAEDAILKQAAATLQVCGDESARKHVASAMAYAEEEIRKDLEHEARMWIEDELKRRLRAVGEEKGA
ncbi:MAG: hypothetical protein JSV26_12375 [bacterium]|nr:MAG: hypothetical protein JSV26_12375 [bacterium]